MANVDRSTRRPRERFAESLRHFFSGQLTQDEFVDRASDFLRDPAANSMFDQFADGFIDDTALRPRRLRGRSAPCRAAKRLAARVMLFLYTDLPYEWRQAPRAVPAPEGTAWPRLSRLERVSSWMTTTAFTFANVLFVLVVWVGIQHLLMHFGREDSPASAFVLSTAITLIGIASWLYLLHRRSIQRQEDLRHGDLSVWPFYHRQDYETALRRPVLLRGIAPEFPQQR